jgi:signal transduction histidine kinase
MFLRVFGVFGSLLLAMTALYALLIIPLQRDSLLKVMYSQAATVSRSIIQACSDAMLTDDFGFIVEHNLQVLQNNKSIQSVVIIPKRGSAMRIAPEGWAMQESERAQLPLPAFENESYGIISDASGESHYRYITPIRFSGVVWGVIRIDFDTSEYENNIDEMYRQLAYISILVVLAILSAGYFFTLWLTRPIVTISKAASRVAQGELDAHVDVNRNDEIGQLSRSFNQMVDALQQSRDQLQNYNQALELKVAERTHELDELNRTLDQRVRDEIAKRKEQENLLIHQSRLAAMGEMIGAIAHQWRQPLNALSLVIQNMRMQHRMGTLTEQSMSRMQEKGEQLVQRMSSTIDEFRNFFKPSKHPEAFKLAQSMRSSADIMEGVFKNHSIVLTIECDEAIELFGIPGEFSQVVLNLLSNAKDAVLDSRQPAPCILVRAIRVRDRIDISVEDNGSGIAPDLLNKVFEPYFTTKEEGKGSGIGLYMSKMIVENNMNGRLEAANTGTGARFTISLPAVRTSAPPLFH